MLNDNLEQQLLMQARSQTPLPAGKNAQGKLLGKTGEGGGKLSKNTTIDKAAITTKKRRHKGKTCPEPKQAKTKEQTHAHADKKTKVTPPIYPEDVTSTEDKKAWRKSQGWGCGKCRHLQNGCGVCNDSGDDIF